MSDNIELETDGSRGRYVLRKNGQEAEMTFTLRDGVMRINHTGVPAELGGQGIGARLVAAAVADAQKDGLRVNPLCSYAAAQFDKHPEWQSLLPE